MTGPAMLTLDDVAVVEVMRLIQAGLVTPGRITPRGAVVHELTPTGVAAFEDFCSDHEAIEVAQACRDGECLHAAERQSVVEQLSDLRKAVAELVSTIGKPTAKQAPLIEAISGLLDETE